MFAIARVKGRSKLVSSVLAAASIAIAPVADFTPSLNTRAKFYYGAKFYTPPPPTPENTLLGVGGV